jgi:pyruvate formate lyase activating enzyme
MKIAGIQKSTIIDYPWKMACVIFTQGCNFRCSFCHNPECVLPEKIMLFQNHLIPEESVFNFLKTRIWLLDWVSICGWEPTLHSDLYDFAKKIKDMWFAVKLDTNWRDYLIIKRLIQDWILDYLAVDLKHNIYSYEQIIWVKEKPEFFYNFQKILTLLLESNIDYEYRTTVVKWLHTLGDVENMAQYIRWAKNYYLQNYVGGNTLDPDFGWQSFSDEELNEFQKIASKYVQNVGIRK